MNMEVLKYLSNKKIYILIDAIILLIGWFCIDKGITISKNGNSGNSTVWISIGTSLIATGIVIFLDLWKNFSIDKIFEKIQNVINDGGVEQLYQKRDIDRYDKLMKNLSQRIDICGYSLGGFFEGFSDSLGRQLENKNIKIRVIFVDYNSEAAKRRAMIEGKSIEQYKNQFETFINFFAKHDNVEIRLIDFPLSSMIFRIDDTLFIGPHFYKKQSKSTLTIELKKNKWMYEEYMNEFDRMWSDAKRI